MVDILLATYNGGQYLESQLLSLMGQTYKDWRLYIHDDGSSDQTLDIIRRYSAFEHRISLIEDTVHCGNAAANFIHLLQFVKAEHIIFCDQDDCWFENKLELLVAEMLKFSGPRAVYCNAYLYDGTRIIGNKTTIFHRDSLQNSLFLNSGVQGCSLMFSKSLLDLIVMPKVIAMHDHLITMAAVSLGKLQHIDLSLMLYRQHERNVTGNIQSGLVARIKMFFGAKKTVLDDTHYQANQAFFEANQHLMDENAHVHFEAYFNFPKQQLLGRLLTIIRHRFSVGNQLTLLLKTLIRKPL